MNHKSVNVRRKFGLVAGSLCLAFASTVALAQNPHFVGGVDVFDQGAQVRVQGSIAGLGNENIDVVITAAGIASVECSNPAGNRAPGQDTEVVASGTATNLEVDNGRANFNITTAPVPAPSAAEVCPNRKWTATITDVDFTSVTINVFQPAGSTNLVLSDTFEL